MVETIAPVVHGESRSRYRLAVAAHVLGSGTSASAVGALAGTVGLLSGAPWGRWTWAVFGAIALAYFLREAASLPLPTFDLRRQVPEWWRTFFGSVTTAFLYGAGLGVGFYTHLRHGTYVVAVAGAVLSGSPIAGALICVPFGVARGLSLLVVRSAHASGDVSRILVDLEALASTSIPRTINAVALATIGLAAWGTMLAG